MDSEILLKANGLCKSYNERKVADTVSLEVRAS